jgi:stage V sporulation protein AC
MEKSEGYLRLTKKHTPKSSIFKKAVSAFFGGGFICALGEGLAFLYLYMGLDVADAYLYVTLSFILLGSLSTALGFFDKIANKIFAGVLVPVCGFSNSITSAAIDTRTEGFVSGVGCKIFTVAGPVILFAAISGTLYGFVYFLVNLFIK